MKFDKKIILLFILIFMTIRSYSQCAMCKAVVESNLKEGGSAGAGLNSGILYLMAMPYVGMFLFALFYYLQRGKKATS